MRTYVSKYLQTKKINEEYIITNLYNKKRISCKEDLILFLNEYKRNAVNEDELLIDELKKAGILISEEEEELLELNCLKKWCDDYKKEIYKQTLEDITILYGATTKQSVNMVIPFIQRVFEYILLHIPILKLNQCMIMCCFLSSQEFNQALEQNGLSSDTSAFVNQKCILILNIDAFKKEEQHFHNIEGILLHEIMHLLLAKYRYTVPFWMEEGLCEWYRLKYQHCCFHLKNNGSDNINFVQLQEKQYFSVSEWYKENKTSVLFYEQCVSFVDFLIQAMGEDKFWRFLMDIDLTQQISILLQQYIEKSLEQLYLEWLFTLKYSDRNQISKRK